MKKRDIITLLILGIIFAILFIFMLINKEEKEEEGIQNSEFSKLTIVSDENIFISIEKNINKIYEYANSEEKALSYIVKNNINIEDYKTKSFKAEEIYVISNLNLYKYFIKGNLYEEFVNELPNFIKEQYLILNYDMETNAYNIEITDAITFLNASLDKHIFEKININNYNRFEYNSLSPKSRAVMYFNDFINKLYSEPKAAYNILTDETQDNYFVNYEEFEKYINKHEYISLAEYSVNGDTIGIKDNYGNEYIFEIQSILEYDITINIAEE